VASEFVSGTCIQSVCDAGDPEVSSAVAEEPSVAELIARSPATGAGGPGVPSDSDTAGYRAIIRLREGHWCDTERCGSDQNNQARCESHLFSFPDASKFRSKFPNPQSTVAGRERLITAGGLGEIENALFEQSAALITCVATVDCGR